ncbi:hypothetical protein HHI36_010552 [Cryptolaemus montrouzieri]|uniref:Uncharacterized protein n=1 Tax=Cryptolaemus montrouzieri TaxID=559131 RepID=A0ABD2MJ08_9CUCU
MTEMKEKQDIEILMWQRKSEELKSKLDQFEWDDGGSPEKIKKPIEELGKVTESDVIKMQSIIAELNETIKELTLDNEDLQTLLEEQRTLRINAEKSKSVEPIPDNMKTENEYMEIVNQKQALQNEIYNISSEKVKLQDELNYIIKLNSEQLEKLRELEEEKIKLEKLLKKEMK